MAWLPPQYSWAQATPWQNIGGALSRNSGLLLGLGAGLLSGNLAEVPQAVAAGSQNDIAYGQSKKADAERQRAINQTSAWFQRQAATDPRYADLLAAVQAGTVSPSDAFTTAMGYKYPAARDPLKIGAGDTLIDPKTYQPIYTAPAAQTPYTLGPNETRFGADNQPIATGQPASKTESPPNGYRYRQDGTLEFIPGGPADPSTAGKTTEATRRNQQLATVIVPELKSLLGDPQSGVKGTFDSLGDLGQQMRGGIPGVGNFLTSPEYQQAQNSMRTIVASYLYSVSGATANPGEVENQVSVLTPRPGDSPQTVAAKKQRLQDMVQAVVAAASGTPITVDPSQLPSVGAPQQQGVNTTSNGVQWSVSP